MIGSSAIVGWRGADGGSMIKRYHLTGQTPKQVVPDQGNLQVVGTSSSLISLSGRLYITFQLNTSLPGNRILYSVGPAGRLPVRPGFQLAEHDHKVSTLLDYASGCYFLICPSREEADKAVNGCHNKKTLPGAASPLQVKYADGELERLEHKLFVGMLPKNVTEVEVSDLFSKYGDIKDLQILRGSQQTSKGCAFLKYETKEQAVAAIEALNGNHRMEGSAVPLVVKWADTEKERLARRAQKAQSQPLNMANADSPQHSSLFGALPMGYMPPYNGYGYQGPGTYGLMPYRMPPLQNQHAYHNMLSSVSQGNAVRGASPEFSPRNYSVPRASYLGSAYPAVSGVQYPLAYAGGIISNRPLSGPPSPIPLAANNHPAASSSVSASSGGQLEGPPGANLFIYHIPQEFGDQELANSFQAFGRVVSAKVFVDKATGVSKCFGFVSYDSPAAAQAAISTMNGCQLGGKKLKVQLKRDNKQNKLF